MKVLHINTNDQDGGAARAAHRIHLGLMEHVDSNFLVQNKTIDSYGIMSFCKRIDKVKILMNKRSDLIYKWMTGNYNENPWSVNFSIFNLIKNVPFHDYDIVNLHWVNEGFVGIDFLQQIKIPIVWTLHDSWPFTGGCHIPYKCHKYENGCYNCEQLFGRSIVDLSRVVYKRKKMGYPSNMTIVCPSNWMADCARKSQLFADYEIKIIPNGLDVNLYSVRNKSFSRDILGIKNDEKIILFGAMSATSDKNKGFEYLCEALRFLYNKTYPKIKIIVFGSNKPNKEFDFGFETVYLGRLYDDISLNILYSAADVMVVPSISESFGQTALEAMASGTPCVAFNATGLKDIIDHKVNGYLAKAYDSSDLADGIIYILENKDRWRRLSEAARKKVLAKFDIKIVAKKYFDLYTDIVKNK